MTSTVIGSLDSQQTSFTDHQLLKRRSGGGLFDAQMLQILHGCQLQVQPLMCVASSTDTDGSAQASAAALRKLHQTAISTAQPALRVVLCNQGVLVRSVPGNKGACQCMLLPLKDAASLQQLPPTDNLLPGSTELKQLLEQPKLWQNSSWLSCSLQQLQVVLLAAATRWLLDYAVACQRATAPADCAALMAVKVPTIKDRKQLLGTLRAVMVEQV